MAIHEIVWPEDRVEHIAGHGITPQEFDEVCFGKSLVLRARSEGKNPVYHVLGQTDSGNYLLCIVIGFADGRGYPVTARPMTPKGKTALPAMEKTMTSLPKIDSISELASFWDTHDVTDFEDQLEEVTELVFVRPEDLTVHLPPGDAQALHALAVKRRVPDSELVAAWVHERVKAG